MKVAKIIGLVIILGVGIPLIITIWNVAGGKYISKSPSTNSKTQTNQTQNATVRFVTPKSNEQWQQGKTYSVKWSGGGTKVALFLIDKSLESTSESLKIVDRITPLDNSGSYEYTVPTQISGTFKWCLDTDLNNPTNSSEVCSDYFSIGQVQ